MTDGKLKRGGNSTVEPTRSYRAAEPYDHSFRKLDHGAPYLRF